MGAIGANGQFKAHVAQATVGEPLRVRVVAAADMAGSEYLPVQLFDGNPDEGGEFIGDELDFVGNPEGVDAWFRWTRMEVGTHQLYARLYTHPSDSADETIATLTVQVHKAMPPHPKGRYADPRSDYTLAAVSVSHHKVSKRLGCSSFAIYVCAGKQTFSSAPMMVSSWRESRLPYSCRALARRTTVLRPDSRTFLALLAPSSTTLLTA